MNEPRFVPWRLPPPPREQTIDAETGIWPISEWGAECARGFVSDSRFARPGDKVIERTNRHTARKWRKVGESGRGR